MKHEKFKVLTTGSQVDAEADPGIKEFLSSGICPKSVSIHYGALRDTVFIGYTEEDTKHSYRLVHSKVKMYVIASDEEVEKAIEDEAAKLEGVICQDVSLTANGLTILFLTTV